MEKFNFQTMMKQGFLVVPKNMLQQLTEERDVREGEIEAFLKILMKVNYTDTVYNNRTYTDFPCRRGESLHSYRDWSRIFHWSIGRTFRFIQALRELGVIDIIAHPDNAALHIRVTEYEMWTGNSDESKILKAKQKKEAEEKKFRIFWNEYHSITQLPKTNIAKAQREWKKLNGKDQQLAIDQIEEYFFHQTNYKFLLQAGSYLANKAYLNEY